MTRDELRRFRVRLRMGETFTTEDVEALLDEIDATESATQRRMIEMQCALDDAASRLDDFKRPIREVNDG